MSLTKPQLILIGIAGIIVVVFGLIFAGVLPGLQSPNNKQPSVKAELNFWTLYDKPSDYEKSVNAFKTLYPEVKINIRKFDDEAVYERALLEALAAGVGPDVFVIGNTSLARQIQKITPLPQAKFSIIRLRELFPQVVEQNFVSQNNIFALPLSIDTLAMYYNRDLFAQAQIATPPVTWENFEKIIPRLTKIEQGGKIIQSAAALGGTKNIDNAADVLSLLMLQTGTQMVSPDLKRATFASKEGENALNFYAQFADPRNKLYSWNNSFPDYLDAFANESVAVIFDYADAANKIRGRNSYLNFAVATTPHPGDAKKWPAYAKYFGYTVSRQSRYSNIAWDFIIQMTTVNESAIGYLDATKKPPALLGLVNQVLTDPNLAAFAGQIFIARNWPQVDPLRIKEIFANMVELVTAGRTTAANAIGGAEDEVTALLTQGF